MFVVIPHVVPRDGCAKTEMLCVWQNEGVTILRSLRGMMRSDPNAIDVPRFIQAHGLHVPIILRPLTTDDCDEWNEVRWRNDDWLKPWESGDPVHGASMSFNEWVRAMRCNERNGTGVVFAIEHHGRIVGQISLGAICYGAMRTGVVGYWSMSGVRGVDMRRWLLRYWLIGRCSTLPGRNCIVWRSTCFPKTNVT